MTTATEERAPARSFEMVRNLMPGPTVIASDNKSTYEVRWMGRGDQDGEDIQPVPHEILRTAQFSRAVRKGILEVIPEGDQASEDAMDLQSSAFQNRLHSSEAAAAAVIDTPLANEMLAFGCIAPQGRPGTVCAEQLMMRASDIEEKAPLCSRHESLRPHFIKTGEPPAWALAPRS